MSYSSEVLSGTMLADYSGNSRPLTTSSGAGPDTDWHDFLDGHVAHFALYDHALSATRVAAQGAAL